MMMLKNSVLLGLIFGCLLISCTEDETYAYYPKPISGQKLVFPEKAYQNYKSPDCNYSFDIPAYSKFEADTMNKNCNGNIVFNTFNAALYLTYIKLDTNLMYNIEYSRKLAYDHSVKADAIEEPAFINAENNTSGIQYKIIGNAASNYQFYATDSTDNFLRGALYFNCRPNYDSLRPTLNFILEDLDHLIQTIRWE